MTTPGLVPSASRPTRRTTETGTRRAVGCRGPLPVLGVVRDVEVAEHRLALEQGALAGREVDVEHGARGGPRLDDDLDGALGRLGVVAQADRVHRLVDGDVPRLAVAGG